MNGRHYLPPLPVQMAGEPMRAGQLQAITKRLLQAKEVCAWVPVWGACVRQAPTSISHMMRSDSAL